MIRTTIRLEPSDKNWLAAKAASEGVSMSEIVRRAVRHFRREEAFGSLLKQTSGIWRKGNGLGYQRRLRKEWR